ncbi:hypothetical protein, partial [Mesorhizobium sp. M8A.F.Ca.ET.161.01.1.1]|uniref:hypothetical protein n=1 Tax=Mesorhizobium sp. M8A.F.Ca.ET.161.01.1.1 TaxID=2563959 RepID=UPI0016790CEB
DFLRRQRLIGCILDMYFPCTILAGAIGSFRICVSIGHGRLNGWRFERLPARKDFPRAETRTTPDTFLRPRTRLRCAPHKYGQIGMKFGLLDTYHPDKFI